MRRPFAILLVALVGVFLLGAGDKSQRFEKLGHNLICTCGCNQILLECNHVGCPASDSMRKELDSSLDKNADNEAVLAGFVAKYGPTVLASPTTKGFDRVAWIMPFVVLTLGILAAVMITRIWKQRTAPAVVAVAPEHMSEEVRARIRQETEG